MPTSQELYDEFLSYQKNQANELYQEFNRKQEEPLIEQESAERVKLSADKALKNFFLSPDVAVSQKPTLIDTLKQIPKEAPKVAASMAIETGIGVLGGFEKAVKDTMPTGDYKSIIESEHPGVRKAMRMVGTVGRYAGIGQVFAPLAPAIAKIDALRFLGPAAQVGVGSAVSRAATWSTAKLADNVSKVIADMQDPTMKNMLLEPMEAGGWGAVLGVSQGVGIGIGAQQTALGKFENSFAHFLLAGVIGGSREAADKLTDMFTKYDDFTMDDVMDIGSAALFTGVIEAIGHHQIKKAWQKAEMMQYYENQTLQKMIGGKGERQLVKTATGDWKYVYTKGIETVEQAKAHKGLIDFFSQMEHSLRKPAYVQVAENQIPKEFFQHQPDAQVRIVNKLVENVKSEGMSFSDAFNSAIATIGAAEKPKMLPFYEPPEPTKTINQLKKGHAIQKQLKDSGFEDKHIDMLKGNKSFKDVSKEEASRMINKLESARKLVEDIVRQEGIPTKDIVIRYEEKGVTPSFDKPQGIYATPARYKSPHKDLGGKKYSYLVNPEANVLKVDASNLIETNRGLVGQSAGIAALKKLIKPEEFNKLNKLSKNDLNKILDKKYPHINWNKYFDQQEMLEGYAGLLAREKGYDAIYAVDKRAPEFTEFVGLTKNSLKPYYEQKTIHTKTINKIVSRITAMDTRIKSLQDYKELIEKSTPPELMMYNGKDYRLYDYARPARKGFRRDPFVYFNGQLPIYDGYTNAKVSYEPKAVKAIKLVKKLKLTDDELKDIAERRGLMYFQKIKMNPDVAGRKLPVLNDRQKEFDNFLTREYMWAHPYFNVEGFVPYEMYNPLIRESQQMEIAIMGSFFPEKIPDFINAYFQHERTSSKADGLRTNALEDYLRYMKTGFKKKFMEGPMREANAKVMKNPHVKGSMKKALQHYATWMMGWPTALDESYNAMFTELGLKPDDAQQLTRTLTNLVYSSVLAPRPKLLAKQLLQNFNVLNLVGYGWAMTGLMDILQNGLSEARNAGILVEYAPEVYKEFGKKYPLDKSRELLVWAFHHLDMFGRTLGYYAARNKWDYNYKKSKNIPAFLKKAGINYFDKTERWRIKDLLRNGKIYDARKIYIDEIVADSHYKYGKADSPLVTKWQLGKLAMQLRSWPINYGELLVKNFKNKNTAFLLRQLFAVMFVMLMAQLTDQKWLKGYPLTSFPMSRWSLRQFLGLPVSLKAFEDLFVLIADPASKAFFLQDPEAAERAFKRELKNIGKDVLLYFPGGLALKDLYGVKEWIPFKPPDQRNIYNLKNIVP